MNQVYKCECCDTEFNSEKECLDHEKVYPAITSFFDDFSNLHTLLQDKAVIHNEIEILVKCKEGLRKCLKHVTEALNVYHETNK